MKSTIPYQQLLEQLNTPFELDEAAVQFYQQNGYVKLKQVLSEEIIAFFDEEITNLVFKLNKLTKPMAERTTYERAFLQVMNLWEESAEVKDFVFSKRLAQIAANLMNVDGVRLYHDQALYKEPTGGITPWHADQFYWPLSNTNTITAWIPLQKTDLEMGPLAFAEKSQEVEIGRNEAISDESERKLAIAMQDFKINETPFDLGEISFHSGWTYHRAGANVSGKPRKVMTMIYMDKDIEIQAPANDFQKADLARWLSNKAINTKADGILNPVLWQK
jgi:ectoine hydroxylase-related dioxygenase (phytanoyl-CoA dioxygenase family)